MCGGDAAEGDRQDEPEDGGNHAHRPAVTLLPLAPLVLLVAQPFGRSFARWPLQFGFNRISPGHATTTVLRY